MRRDLSIHFIQEAKLWKIAELRERYHNKDLSIIYRSYRQEALLMARRLAR